MHMHLSILFQPMYVLQCERCFLFNYKLLCLNYTPSQLRSYSLLVELNHIKLRCPVEVFSHVTHTHKYTCTHIYVSDFLPKSCQKPHPRGKPLALPGGSMDSLLSLRHGMAVSRETEGVRILALVRPWRCLKLCAKCGFSFYLGKYQPVCLPLLWLYKEEGAREEAWRRRECLTL